MSFKLCNSYTIRKEPLAMFRILWFLKLYVTTKGMFLSTLLSFFAMSASQNRKRNVWSFNSSRVYTNKYIFYKFDIHNNNDKVIKNSNYKPSIRIRMDCKQFV